MMRARPGVVAVTVVALVGALLACKRKQEEPPAPVASPENVPASPASTATNIAGNYTISEGKNPNGSTYKGSVSITPAAAPNLFNLSWKVGASSFAGLGIQDGDLLAVGWSTTPKVGVVVYKVNGGRMEGKWASPGAKQLGTEVLEGKGSLDGSYTITSATNPAGKSYKGTAHLKASGGTIVVDWKLDSGETYSGVGILHGTDQLVVGWPKGAGVVEYAINGSELSGSWAQKPGPVGHETIRKQ